MAVGSLKTNKHILQMYGYPSSSMLALDLSSLIPFQNGNTTGDQPDRKPVDIHAMPNFDAYSKQWPTLWPVGWLMCIRPKQNWLYFVMAFAL